MERRSFILTAGAFALLTAFGARICAAADRQRGWRRCTKCQNLVWDGGHCPAGEHHSFDDPTIYTLGANAPTPNGQEKWRVCRKCMVLWYSGAQAKGRCPEGGGHGDEGSWNYVLESNGKGHKNWNQCSKCQGLFYGIGSSAGVCPAGGKHEKVVGIEYTLELQSYKNSVTGKGVAGFEVLDAVMEKYLKRIGATAAALTVTRSHHSTPNGMQPTADSHPLYSRGYGWCDVGQTQPMQPDSVIDIGSCTKTFSAAAIRQMALDGKIDLNASICKLLNVKPRGKVIDDRFWNITLNNLLDMKTGWLGEPLDQAYQEAGNAPVLYYDWGPYVLEFLMTKKLKDNPGEKFEYDNLAYGLLEAVVQRFSGVDHPQYLRTRLGRPFGIADLSTDYPATPVWNAYREGTTSPPWISNRAGGHLNVNYSTPLMAFIMRYFTSDGRLRDNATFYARRTGSFESSTAVMVWRLDGLNWAAAFNGSKVTVVTHDEIEKGVNEALDKVVKGKKIPGVPRPPQNMLLNGSFEEGQRVGDIIHLDPGSTSIKGWKVTRGQIDLYGSGLKAEDGGRCLDLHGSPGYGGIEQAFKTKIGQRYRVTFAMAASPGGSVPVKRLAVRAAGTKEEFAFDSRDRKPDNMGWVEYAWEFEAVAEQTTLEFHTVMDSDAYFGPAIDNVRVRPVTERR